MVFKIWKLQKWSPEVADLKLRTTEKIAIAKLRLRSYSSLKSYGIAVAEVRPSSCGIAGPEKSCACPPLSIWYLYGSTSGLGYRAEKDLWTEAATTDMTTLEEVQTFMIRQCRKRPMVQDGGYQYCQHEAGSSSTEHTETKVKFINQD
jgi:hypothetical protein